MPDETRAHPSDEPFIAGDALRALACLAVFAFHGAFGAALAAGFPVRLDGDTGVHLGDAFGAGDLVIGILPAGVYVFFALSAYLLSRRFLRAFVEGTPMPNVRSFLRNRALRIVPAFWVVAGLTIARYGIGDSSVWEVLAIPAFLQLYVEGPVTKVIEHAWTIDTEWALYLGLPLAAVLLTRSAGALGTPRSRLALVASAIAALTVASLGLRALGPVDTTFQRLPPTIAWSFAAGLALATAEIAWARRLRGARWAPGAAAMIAVAAGGLLVAHAVLPAERPGLRALAAFLAVTCVLAGPLLLQWSHARAWRVLDNRLLNWIGVRSYSFYLLHFLVALEVGRLIADQPTPAREVLVTLPPALVATCALSALCYRYVERPFLERKRRPSAVEVGDVADVRPVALVVGGLGGEPCVEDLADDRR